MLCIKPDYPATECLAVFAQQRALNCNLKPRFTNYTPQSSGCSSLNANIPNPVRGGRWDVDSQRPTALLHLHCEQQGRVGHLLHLFLDELCLRGLLEVL